MNSKDFTELIDGQLAECRRVMKGKGFDYTAGDDDRLINFKNVGARIGLSPKQCWAVYFLKQVDSVLTVIKTGRSESEPIESRFTDIINYALLGLALFTERCEPQKCGLAPCGECGGSEKFPNCGFNDR